jgi:vanillate/3-O-methylgallate O-demethylase
VTVVSLQDKLNQAGSAVRMLRESQMGPYVYPIPAEFSNWRDEQRAWRETDALRLLSHVGINSFANFGRNKAKQLVTCNQDGYVIGDVILFGLEDDRYLIIGRPVVANWVQFNAETGGFNVRVERDERSLSNPKPRKTYRFEIQGPSAPSLLEKLNGAPLEPIRFFNMGEIRIAGRKVRALRHGMPRSRTQSSRRDKSSGCGRSVAGHMAAWRSNPVGFHRPFRRSTAVSPCAPIASGSRPTASNPWRRWGEAFTRIA